MNRRAKVLVVDDDQDLILLLERVLRQEFPDSIDLTAMSDSVAAKRWGNENRPEVVITDLNMPVVDGFEVLRDAKKWNPDARLVVFSSRAEKHADDLLASYGVTDCIPKSSNLSALFAAIRDALTKLAGKTALADEPRPVVEPPQIWPTGRSFIGLFF